MAFHWTSTASPGESEKDDDDDDEEEELEVEENDEGGVVWLPLLPPPSPPCRGAALTLPAPTPVSTARERPIGRYLAV